jgi:hypothetical protein
MRAQNEDYQQIHPYGYIIHCFDMMFYMRIIGDVYWLVWINVNLFPEENFVWIDVNLISR